MKQSSLAPGLYDALITDELHGRLASLAESLVDRSDVDAAELPRRLAHHLRGLVELALKDSPRHGTSAAAHKEEQLALANRLISVLQTHRPKAIDAGDALHGRGELLAEVDSQPRLPGQLRLVRPVLPLADSTLLVNAPDDPGVGHALKTELPSADHVELLCSFIKWSGLRLLQDALSQFLQSKRRLRVLTTVYMGATDRRALDWLVAHGAEVRVSYDTRRTRLHAKAWLFHRSTGTSTAYIGSSNLSSAALQDGLEWNVRLSEVENPSILKKFQGFFESYWAQGEFEDYHASEAEQVRMDRALRQERTETDPDMAFFDLRPYPYQRELLERLQAERLLHQRWKNLVVAATGTGKTVVAALDYQRLNRECPPFAGPGLPGLLFVAHRKEILTQSLNTFRMVLKKSDFGELLVDGKTPQLWTHVFASVQSLAQLSPADIDPRQFPVVIIDEFHHAAASSYQRWLEHLTPTLLLGLTATPERPDAQPILHWFDHRIAAELRLWTALDLGILCPFNYFGVNDDTDLSKLEWRSGGYAPEALSALYTGNDARLRLILKELHEKITDLKHMRALGFCVSVAHAQFMADRFQKAGLRAACLHADTPREQRQTCIDQLRQGTLQLLFTVDLFNEGVDIPEINTLLLLRPTESAVVFLQQLGRGLRLHESKSSLTVLDFIGQAHRKFRYDLRFRALLGRSRQELKIQLEHGFPCLPAGCSLQLDRVAQQRILKNLQESVPASRTQLLSVLRDLGPTPLSDLLRHLGMELREFYSLAGSLTALRRTLGWLSEGSSPDEARLSERVGSLTHLDDPERLTFYLHGLRHPSPPRLSQLTVLEQRRWQMLMVQLWGAGQQHVPLTHALERLWETSSIREEVLELLMLLEAETGHLVHSLDWEAPVPIRVHGTYHRAEIFSAFGLITDQAPFLPREGVWFDKTTRCDLLFVTLKKSEKLFSPSTRYNDFAISPTLFHWESQSTTRSSSEVGQRYIHHQGDGSRILLFVREESRRAGETLPFTCLGFAHYLGHEGERPMAITWELQVPIPAECYPAMAIAV